MIPVPDWAIGVGFIVVVVSVAKAVARRISPFDRVRGGRLSRREVGPELEELQLRLGVLEEGQRRLGEGEDVQARLNEVEERLDFVERMLAKQRDAERVTPPKQ